MRIPVDASPRLAILNEVGHSFIASTSLFNLHAHMEHSDPSQPLDSQLQPSLEQPEVQVVSQPTQSAQRKSVKSEKSELKYSDRQKFQLIDAISRQPAIWDKGSELYREKDKTRIWEVVRKAANYGSKYCKTSFHLNLLILKLPRRRSLPGSRSRTSTSNRRSVFRPGLVRRRNPNGSFGTLCSSTTATSILAKGKHFSYRVRTGSVNVPP